jgi:hypothetical protein
MLALKYLLMILGVALCGSAGALVVYDVYISEQLRRLLARSTTSETGGETGITARRRFGPVRWRSAQRLAVAGVLLPIPDGTAGVGDSQIWGARRGTFIRERTSPRRLSIAWRCTTRTNGCTERQRARLQNRRTKC